MVVITVKKYIDAGVHTIKIGDKKLFWVKMVDVQNGLGVKNNGDLLRKEMYGTFETRNLTKEQKNKYIRSEGEIRKKSTDNFKFKYARSDIMEKIIKNCRGLKTCSDGVNRMEKENQRENFRSLLGFKKNVIFQRKEY